MAKQVAGVSRVAEIEEVMRTTNLMRIEAAAVVAARYGEDVSDIVGPDGPLTAEERERFGIGGTIMEAVQADLARAAEDREPTVTVKL